MSKMASTWSMSIAHFSFSFVLIRFVTREGFIIRFCFTLLMKKLLFLIKKNGLFQLHLSRVVVNGTIPQDNLGGFHSVKANIIIQERTLTVSLRVWGIKMIS